MRIITRTVWGASLQTALLLGLSYETDENSTLNQKFNIRPELKLEGRLPHVNYLCIGNGGHRMIAGADGIPYTSPINHRASDAALYNHLPFVVRPINEDLTIEQRERYALRRIETIRGEQYIVYYLKRMNLSNIATFLEHTVVEEGVLKKTPFNATNENLNPTPPDLPHAGVITTDGSYLTSSAILTIQFEEFDVNELVNAALILYENEQYAAISEIGLCSGVDTVVNASESAGAFNYREAIEVQIATHITGYYPVGYTNRGFELQIEAGATEPMLGEGVQGSQFG
jgi:hypothetical protein